MKVAMIYPTRESEKAISGYSKNLVQALNKNKVKTDDITYDAGSPLSFFKIFPKLKNYDILHLQHEYNLLGGYGSPFYIVLLFLALLKKGKLIITMHTALSQKEKFVGSKLKTFFRKILYKTQNKLINFVSDLIFVHSDFFVPILEKEYGIPKKKIIVLPQGILGNVKIISKAKAKKELGLSGKIYLIIGNLTADSGADIILRQSNKIGKTIVVVSSPISVNKMMGQKRLSNYLESLIKISKKNNFSKYIRFDIAPINDKMALWWKYFCAADFVLQAYRGGIGSGIFTHAMATKTPVIASNIDFFKDIEKNYGCIKIAKNEKDYSSIIKEAIKPKNYKKMKEESKRYAKERSWNEITKEYKKIYSSF